nr:SDR family oxidoreductase [Uliginosibacterium gangwonense]
MRILICGASGFIGQALCERLALGGYDVLRGVRRCSRITDVQIDFSHPLAPEMWAERLRGIDVVVNAVGIITENTSSRFADVHYRSPAALFAGCVLAGVKRVVQISALGAEQGTTPYFRSKYAADQCVMKLPIEWCILCPSLVYGQNGTSAAMFRMSASLPLMLVPDLGDARFQPIHVDDLVDAIVASITQVTARGKCIDVVGASRISYREMLDSYRRQMGFPEAWHATILAPVMAIAARFAGMIPGAVLNTDNWKMLQAGNTGDIGGYTRLVGHVPRGIDDFIAPQCAEVARSRALVLWRIPLLRYVMAFVWIASAYVSACVYPLQASLELLAPLGLSGAPAQVALFGASVLDLIMGVACVAYPQKGVWLIQAGLVIAYSLLIAVFEPAFLAHPFGPVLKNLPILALLLILYTEES